MREVREDKEELSVTDVSYTAVSTSLSIASLTSFPSAHFNSSRIAPGQVKRNNSFRSH